MKIKIWLLAAVLGLGLFHLWAEEPKAINLGYGIFERSKEAPSASLGRLAEKPRGRRLPVDTLILTTLTNQIPCRLGTAFGVNYCITNLARADGETIDLDFITHHPRITLTDGRTATYYHGPLRRPVRNGAVHGTLFFELAQDNLVVPGYWEMNLNLHGQRLLRQSFQLVKPEEKPAAPPATKPAETPAAKKAE